MIEDPVTIGVKPMIWIILSKAVSKEELVWTPDREGNVVFNVLMSVNGQAYARTRDHLLNESKMQTISQWCNLYFTLKLPDSNTSPFAPTTSTVQSPGLTFLTLQ